MTTAPRPPLDVVGITEIGSMLQVPAGTVSQWRHRGLLPSPDKRLACGDLWHAGTIWDWAAQTGRLP